MCLVEENGPLVILFAGKQLNLILMGKSIHIRGELLCLIFVCVFSGTPHFFSAPKPAVSKLGIGRLLKNDGSLKKMGTLPRGISRQRPVFRCFRPKASEVESPQVSGDFSPSRGVS